MDMDIELLVKIGSSPSRSALNAHNSVQPGRFLHDITKLSGNNQLSTEPGHQRCFNLQQFSADFGPGKPGGQPISSFSSASPKRYLVCRDTYDRLH
jgi:hypothetical protein